MAKRDITLDVLRAVELHSDRLMALPNVVGTGTGYRERRGKVTDDVVAQVFVSRKYPRDHLPDWAIIPDTLPEAAAAGRPVSIDVIDVGFVYAAQDVTRYRPVPGGCSIGHQSQVDASTLGGWASDRTDDAIVLLSCNHCIANIGVASVPGGIVQPGRFDGGAAPADLIGALKRFIPIITGVVPLPVTPVDAAIGTITVDRTDNVLAIGPAIYELGTPALGAAVQKRGRTTLFTTNGTITSLGVTVNVNYGTVAVPVIGTIGNSFRATSTDGNAFANRGDSGSLIFNQAAGALNGTFPVIGMFFAVSNGGVTTFHNDINTIFAQLNLETICAAVARAIIEAIFGASAAAGAVGVSRKEAQLRRLRDRVLEATPFGKVLADAVATEAAELSRVIQEDEEAFGLAVRTFDPWVRKPTNLDILESELDPATSSNFGRLADRVAKLTPRLKPKMTALKVALEAVEGMRIQELLATAHPTGKPKPKRRG
jgi:hypothetical protein